MTVRPEPTTGSEGAEPTESTLEGEDSFAALIEPADDASPSEQGAGTPKASRVQGWRRIFRGNRALWIVAAVAVVSLIGGLLLGRFIVSPADAAANAQAPAAGLITVPVEFGELSNDVTIRGDVGYADPVQVSIDAADIGGPAVVTGQVPAVGAILSPLSVALEVAGRPVIVLPGELPSYRTLRLGVAGPDVLQFKQAMVAVGIDAGDAGSNVFDGAAASAVTALYAAVGYEPPAAPEGSADAIRSAEENVRAADQSIQAAKNDLGKAGAGPSAVDVRMADNAVAAAQRAIATAQAKGDPADAIADLQDQLALAELQRQQLSRPADTSPQRASLDSAYSQRDSAVQALAQAREAASAYLPASEALYLTQLPRRVDDVAVKRGAILSGAAMTVSGADVQVRASATADDAALLTVGDKATFELPDGTTHGLTISRIDAPGAAGADSGGSTNGGSTNGGSSGGASSTRWSITLQPDPLTPEQISALQGQNVRVSVPVGSTQGEVLSVPLAALTAGPGGESRVEVVIGDPKDGKKAETRLVDVETGLAASGYVEVAAAEGELVEGDLVVVGQ